MARYTTLFLDIGGVLLTNGWDRHGRAKAAEFFKIDKEELEDLNRKYVNILETGKMTLDEYLEKVVFWKQRDFTLRQFKDFMYSLSKPLPDMIPFLKELKGKYHLRYATVSNESADLTRYRIDTFDLRSFIDDFFISCYVGYQKPDPHIYQIALDVTQVPKEQVIYIDDRPNLVEAGKNLGITSLQNENFQSTREKLTRLL